MTERIRVYEKITDVCISSLLDQSTPDDVIRKLQHIKQEYVDRDIRFILVSYGYDGAVDLELWGNREENDKEYKARIALAKKTAKANEKTKALKETRERKQYERLKKKFG